MKKEKRRIIKRITALLLMLTLICESVDLQGIVVFAQENVETVTKEEPDEAEVTKEKAKATYTITDSLQKILQEVEWSYEDDNLDWSKWDALASFSMENAGKKLIEDGVKVIKKLSEAGNRNYFLKQRKFDYHGQEFSFIFTAKGDVIGQSYFSYQYKLDNAGRQGSVFLTDEYKTYLLVKKKNEYYYCYSLNEDGSFVLQSKGKEISNSMVDDRYYFGVGIGAYLGAKVYFKDFKMYEGDLYEYIENHKQKDTTPPIIESIQSKGSRINKDSRITVNAYDDTKVSKIRLEYQNGENWTLIEEKEADEEGRAVFVWKNEALPDGSYVIRAAAIDESGNESLEDYTRTYTIDNTGIQKINLTEITSDASFVSLRWEDVPEEDFAYFQVEQKKDKDFVSVGTVAEVLGMHITNLAPNTEYTFRVVGYDNLGNRGEPSEEAVITTKADTTPPVISSFYPAAKNFKDMIPLSITVTDNIGAVKAVFEYSLDEKEWKKLTEVEKTPAKTNVFAYDWDVSELPEGTVYVRVQAYDEAGSENAFEEGILTNSYQIDRTAPSAINDLKAEGLEGYVSLQWTAPKEKDISHYRIYRAEEEGEYKVLAKECRTANYYDSTAEHEKTYRYQITSIDQAGNESEVSNEAKVQVSRDTKSPTIYSVSPREGEIVGKDATIKALVYDNVKVSKVWAEYQMEGSEGWTKLEEVSVNAKEKLVTFPWDSKDLKSGTCHIKVQAEDENGNKSEEFTATFQLDADAPKASQLTLKEENWQLGLSWQECSEKDFAYFQLYRKSYEESQYKKIYEGSDNFYTDKEITPETNYEYYLLTCDKYNNNSKSETVTGSAGSEDTILPTANAGSNLSGVEGTELAFDGTASSDNVRIVEYSWDMGDNTTETGAQPKHTYQKAGTYQVTLTVKDVGGNTDTTTITVVIYEASKAGTITLQIVDQNNLPLPYAYVYVNDNSIDSGKTLTADSSGKITISGESGTYQFAAYKQNYLPAEKYIDMEQGKNKTATLMLEAGEVVVGDLKVTKMELEDMIAAGIDLTNPSNYNSFTYVLTLAFVEAPIPVEYEIIVAGDGTTTSRVTNSGGLGGNFESGQSNITFYPIPTEETEAEEQVPLLAYLTDSGSISWMKEMFMVELGIINAAAPKFVLEDSSATLNLPKGISFAELNTKNQNKTIDLGDIKGQQSASAIWYIKGDESGDYKISADFTGTLQPFEKQINATFASDVKVQTGEGLQLTIHPEDAAYVGESYYIQYELTNNSDRTFYNLTTTFGDYTLPGKYTSQKLVDQDTGEEKIIESRENDYYIADANKSKTIPVMYQGDTLEIGVFQPGDTLYGTTVMAAPQGTGEYEEGEYYFKLIDSFVDILEGANTGVNVVVSPIKSHASVSIVKHKSDENNTWGDPVDTTSGAFVEETEALAVNGATPLSLDLSYSSLLTATPGELGRGWSHNFQTCLKEEGGFLNLYWTPDAYSVFVREEAVTHSAVYGNYLDTGKIALSEKAPNSQKYLSISTGMEQAVLQRKEDFTYTLTLPSGMIYDFDESGRLVRMTDKNKREVTLTYQKESDSDNTLLTVTETATGQQLYLRYNKEKQLIQVSDKAGRHTGFTYEGQCLTAITNPLGETTTYTYDGAGHILSKTNGAGITKVTNQYDTAGRVLHQKDANEKDTSFVYTEAKNGNLTTVITDRDGGTQTVVSDRSGNIIRSTNGEGETSVSMYDSLGNQLSVRDPEGNTLYYKYDSLGNQTQITDAYGCITSMTYDSQGNMTSVKDGNGKETKFTYNADNLLTKAQYSSGKVVSYAYNQQGQLTKETIEGLGTKTYQYTDGYLTKLTDMNGNTNTYQYDVIGNLIKVTDSMGMVTKYSYDAMNRLLREDKMQAAKKAGSTKESVTESEGAEEEDAGETDPEQIYASIIYTYDADGSRSTITDARGNTTQYTYDKNGELSAITDASGNTVTYQKDNEGHILTQTAPDGSQRSYTYDKAGRVLTETDEENCTIRYEYNKRGDMIKTTDAKGESTLYAYYPNGKLQEETYADGSKTLYTYDKCWNLTRITKADQTSTSYEYDSVGNLLRIRDALGNEQNYQYDIYGRLQKETDPMGNTTAYEYDSEGNLLKETNALGETVSYEYDSENRLITLTHPDEAGEKAQIHYTYDEFGRNTKVTDECGSTAETAYDKNNNITTIKDATGTIIETRTYGKNNQQLKTTDALGITDTYTYDRQGSLIKTTAQAGTGMEAVTAYTYNSDGTLSNVKDAEEGSSSYTYDKNKNIIKITDPMGGETKYTYDKLNRVTREENAIGSRHTYTYNSVSLPEKYTNANGQDTDYTYDKAGRLIKVTDEAGTITYEYDKNGNITKVTDETGTITRTYDALNRVTSYTNTSGNTIRYSYNPMGALAELTYPDGGKVTYHYYDNGKLKSVTDQNHKKTTYEYDGNGLLTARHNSNGTTDSYVYDKAGQLIRQTVTKDDTIIADNKNTADNKDSEAEQKTNDTEAPKENTKEESILSEISYTYDEAGNITSKETTETDGAIADIQSVTMTYDSANRLLTYNGENVIYDSEGNMTYGPDAGGIMTEYTYNCRNQLIQAGAVTYEYDAEGTRTSQTNTETGVRTAYITDTNRELPQVLQSTETKENGETETTTYVYGNGLLTQNNTKNGTYHFHYNNIGSTILLTDEMGSKAETYSYGAYGELLSGDREKTDYLYNGKYGVATDSTGLYYMRARYYNVSIKRFLNQDIVTGTITNSQSLNRYAYVQGNPVKLTDPFGLSPSLNISGMGHAALNLLGIIPGLDICDAINAAWYLAEGDYANAAISAVAVLPMIGSTIGNGLKWGAKGAANINKVADTIKLGSRIAGNGGSLLLSGAQTAEAIKNIHANYVEMGKVFTLKNVENAISLGFSVAGMGLAGASLAKSGKALKNLYEGKPVSEVAAVSNATKKVDNEGDSNFKLRLSEKVKILKQKGDYRQALDIHYEDLIRRKTGGESKIIQGREYDVVTQKKLIQAKRSNSAINNPDNFLKGKTRKQIKETARVANELGLQAEYWFKYGVHPKVREYIESKGIKVIIGFDE